MITSLDNKTVKQYSKLHQKKYRNGEFLLLDEKIIEIAKEYGYLKTLVYTDKMPFAFDNCIEVSKEVLNKISKRDDLKYIGIANNIKESNSYKNRVLILDELQDPLNIGRILEGTYLFGFDSIILSENCADIYNEKCISNSKGAIFRVNIKRSNIENEISCLKQNGFKVFATGLRNQTKELHDIKTSEKMAFVLGNEGSGVRENIMDICDDIVKIDMMNIDSLNVSMAANIIMYNFSI